MKNGTFLFTTAVSFLLILAAESVAHSAERFSVQSWKSSFAQAVNKNDSKKILQLVNFKDLQAQAVPDCVDCENKEKMKKARRLFAQGDIAGAEKIYDRIPKGTDLWFEAVEERGWAHFRKDEYEKALAQTKTLLSPQFASVVQSEAYLLQSLTQLKICDYQGVLETDKAFKENQRSRLVEMQALEKSGSNQAFQDVLPQLNKFPLEFTDLGGSLTHLPLLFYRDTEFQNQLLKFKISQAALEVLSSGQMAKIRNQFEKMNSESSVRMKSRMAALAEQENAEDFKIVQKLNLVEVEAIQRIHTDIEISKSLYKKGQFKTVTEDQLVFMDDGHPWIDELDKYEVSAKTCAKGIRRKM